GERRPVVFVVEHGTIHPALRERLRHRRPGPRPLVVSGLLRSDRTLHPLESVGPRTFACRRPHSRFVRVTKSRVRSITRIGTPRVADSRSLEERPAFPPGRPGPPAPQPARGRSRAGPGWRPVAGPRRRRRPPGPDRGGPELQAVPHGDRKEPATEPHLPL